MGGGNAMKNLIIALCVILPACSPSVRMPKIVKIPVPVTCPEPRTFVRPHLPIADLPEGPGADIYVRAVESSLVVLIGYANELETTLGGYRK